MPPPTTVGRYQLRAKLGAGAFGTVYRAYDPNLDREIALKILKSKLLVATGARKRFQREARAAARLDHPNIVPIHDADTSGKHCYIASKLIAGQSLDQLIPENGLDPCRAVALTVQLLDALAHAHALGILHRDVKPSNCLVAAQDRLYLTDFGLAGSLADESTRLTKEGAAIGTAAYMAPEQAQGQRDAVGPAADQYSAGVALFELLTGRRPFSGPPLIVIYHAVHTAVPPPTQFRPELDATLETICLTALAKRKEDRFADCRLFAEALRAWLVRQAPLAAPVTFSGPLSAPSQLPTVSDRNAVTQNTAELPASLKINLGDSVKIEFVFIPKGKFKMGSPSDENERNPFEKGFDAEKQHDVEITRPFYLAKYPVTQEQYSKLVGDNPSWFRKGGHYEERLTDVLNQNTSRFPVEYVSWDEANTFCTEKLKPFSAQMPEVLRQQNYRFALPTEAQWEYACRAGTTTPFSFGSILNGQQANCDGSYPYGTDEKGPYKQRTTKVGVYGENPWELCDMHGNVWQWCQDYYGPYDESLSKADPLRIVNYSEEQRVLRSGSWFDSAGFCRAAFRFPMAPGLRNYLVGFRVALRLD